MQTIDEILEIEMYNFVHKAQEHELHPHYISDEKISSFRNGFEFAQRWILAESELPQASEDKNDWWTSDIGEVFPYSKKCIVENDEGEFFINNYSVIENCWGTFCGTIVKWRFL